jgi:hypothetical protein
MTKPLFIFFFLWLCTFNLRSQEKDLTSKTWYCSCNFNSDTLLLSADNINQPTTEVRFSTSGKLLLKNIKKRTTDSSFVYNLKKKSLVLQLNLKDSVKTLHYGLNKVKGKRAYDLSMKYSAHYHHKKGDEAIIMRKFTLIKGKKRKTIFEGEEIAVFSQCKAIHNDSINRAVWGSFAGYIADTLLIDSDQYVEHNFYKKHTDTLHYIAPLLLDTVIRIKVPIKYITGIYNQREPLSSISSNASFIAMGTGLVCISSSILGGEGNASSIFAQAGVISFLTIPISLGVNMVFSKQKFYLQPTKKHKEVWTHERHMPRTIITQRNKKAKK